MLDILNFIMWLVIGVCSFLACVCGAAAEWTTFWGTYGALMMLNIDNLISHFRRKS